MTKDLEKRPLPEREQHLRDCMSSERFLKKQGLGNEVPFFICPYRPQEANDMMRVKDRLIKNLKKSSVHVLNINLYDLAVELIKARGLWDRVLAKENSLAKEELKELLQGVLDPQAHLVPAMEKKMKAAEFDIMFITGVGEVFPYIRSHTILNNLQSKAKEKPTVMFFPGAYKQSATEGASLNLFGLLHDDKYYRAFNILKYGT